jgi:hypothetical protein
MPLKVDTLLSAAKDKAKYDAFGDDWFLEPLGVHVDALNREAQLSDVVAPVAVGQPAAHEHAELGVQLPAAVPRRVSRG